MDCVTLEVGEVAIALQSADKDYCALVRGRYGDFVREHEHPSAKIQVECRPESGFTDNPDEDLVVDRERSRWILRRGDFHAEWDSATGLGTVRQVRSPYATDSLLRVLHSLILARQGGFLLHAASFIMDGNAYVFSGVSGSGKTTLSRMAPKGAVLLTDEVSYVRKIGLQYFAYGTPFTGELALNGENVCAPLRAVYLIHHGPENVVTPIAVPNAISGMMRNVLFFAADEPLVQLLFQSVCDFVLNIPVKRLEYVPDESVWEVIA